MPSGGSRKNASHKACEGKGCERCNGTGKAPVGNKKLTPEHPPTLTAPNKSQASEIIASLDIPDAEWEKLHPLWNKEPYVPCQCWKCLWRYYARKDRGGAEYLWNRAEGRPVQTVNHLHDKPIEHVVTVTLAEAISKARKRAGK